MKFEEKVNPDGKQSENIQISYFVHEAVVARQERTIKRLWILCIIIFLALIGTNAGWIWYESQFQDVVVTETTQDGAGVNIISGKDANYGAESQTGTNQGTEGRESE